ncbi:hypothetical protein G7061_06945 [Erysipelothrix sp. HDW6B]|uniref:hypothetical protein n=1 Tax=Erysipelothrix sp. HDW6B TaxID=2714929 RepID=UPI00140E6437|nr:hypothetical protein [Erysipelothrix sp. HDW6B]QIK86359.1 hypothetical protein G7061_06945 [Erysipelothrix sp. HDW6B]
MNKLEREKRNYRIQKRYLEQLEKIISYKKNLPEYIESGVEINERHIIEEAIENYYVQVFGDDVMSHVIPQMTTQLSNNLDLKFNNFFENMGQFLNALLLTESVNKEMLGLLLQIKKFNIDNAIDDPKGFENAISENEQLYHILENYIIKKSE